MEVLVLLMREMVGAVGEDTGLAKATYTPLLNSESPISFTAATLNLYVTPVTNLVSVIEFTVCTSD